MMVVILVIDDGDLRPLGMEFLDLRYMRSGVAERERRRDVQILDIFQDVASVRIDAHGWIDYMHLAKVGGNWMIVNVLWEIRR